MTELEEDLTIFAGCIIIIPCFIGDIDVGEAMGHADELCTGVQAFDETALAHG